MQSHPNHKAHLALASVCFFWGTTYLAIRMALETVPPLFLIAGRFCLSGGLMMGWVLLSGKQHLRRARKTEPLTANQSSALPSPVVARRAPFALPRGRELLITVANGVLILGVGNGCLVFAEMWISSSLAALFIAISPFWMVALETLVPGGERLRWPALAGILTGFLGAGLLVAPSLAAKGMSGDVWKGFLILQLGSLSWGLGSILQKRNKGRAHPIVSGAVQQMAAGVAFLIPALLARQTPVSWTSRGMWAVLYLVVFGSIVGYSSYIYALDRLPVSLVSIYTYVNPVVAALLGWYFYREPFGRREVLAMAVIFCGVAVVKTFSRPGPFQAPSPPVPRQSS
ncbi:MAG: EamA family transporter [Acidobacteriia bacterium]|nr:EamA family transporter [Terriglobia bacterium]